MSDEVSYEDIEKELEEKRNSESVFDFERVTGPMPEGVHRFQIINFDERMGGSGYPYLNYTLECVDEAPWKGQYVWLMLSLSPAARFKLEEFLDAVGAPRSGKGSGREFVGHFIRAETEIEVFDEKPRVKLGRILSDSALRSAGEKSAGGKPKVNVGDLVKSMKNLPKDVVEEEATSEEDPF